MRNVQSMRGMSDYVSVVRFNVQFNSEVVSSWTTLSDAVAAAKALTSNPQCRLIASVVREEVNTRRMELQRFEPKGMK